MGRSLLLKISTIFIVTTISIFVFFGIILLYFSMRNFIDDEFDNLSNNVLYAAQITEEHLSINDFNYMDKESIESYYAMLGNSISSMFFLCDSQGNILVCSEGENCRHMIYRVSAEILTEVATGEYLESETLGGIYDTNHFTAAVPLTDENNNFLGAVFASNETTAVDDYLSNIWVLFLFSAIMTMLVALPVIYIIVNRMLKPLRQMTKATIAYSEGDFSADIDYGGDDEIGVLALSFNNMKNSLSELEAMRRSFVANVSHELKTPLTIIDGYLSAIQNGAIPKEEQERYITIVTDETKRLSRLIGSLLNLARIEAGDNPLVKSPIEISALIFDVLFSFERVIDEKGILVEGLSDIEKQNCLCDRDLIYQVIYNLVDNAVKFTSEGEAITVNTYLQDKKYYISIKNSGTGIASKNISKVFDRFFKEDESRSIDKSGVGIGLYLVKTITELHGGDIIVKSEEGQYTEFIFSLFTEK